CVIRRKGASISGYIDRQQSCRVLPRLVDPAKKGAHFASRSQTLLCAHARRRSSRLIGCLLKQQRGPLAQDVALAANKPQPVLQFLAFRLRVIRRGCHINYNGATLLQTRFTVAHIKKGKQTQAKKKEQPNR